MCMYICTAGYFDVWKFREKFWEVVRKSFWLYVTIESRMTVCVCTYISACGLIVDCSTSFDDFASKVERFRLELCVRG